jgi:hypothetical protein
MATNDKAKLTGAGPWLFDNPNGLSPGEPWVIDLPGMKYNGQSGWFKKYLPLDISQVTNTNTSENVRVVYNGQYEDLVLANSVETFSDQGIRRVRVVNASDNVIPAGDIAVSLKKEPYGADERAREETKKGPIANVVENFTGLSL